MSIMHCDKHDVNYDTDFVEDCFKCGQEQAERVEGLSDHEENVLRLRNQMIENTVLTSRPVATTGLNEDDAIEREHDPVEYYVEPELPSEHNL